MKKYRGYYIDGATFKSQAEIDDFIKENAKKGYIQALRIFDRRGTMEASAFCSERAQHLHTLGYTWEEIEEIETATLYGEV